MDFTYLIAMNTGYALLAVIHDNLGVPQRIAVETAVKCTKCELCNAVMYFVEIRLILKTIPYWQFYKLHTPNTVLFCLLVLMAIRR